MNNTNEILFFKELIEETQNDITNYYLMDTKKDLMNKIRGCSR
jgi:hypothetical protein